MFISRKTIRMRSKNKVGNSEVQMQSSNPIQVSQKRIKNDIEIVRYPAVLYLIGVLMLIGFIYLIYSANGGAIGIPGFRQKLWWQYFLSFVLLIFAFLIFFFSKIESVCIFGDKIQFSKTFFFGFKDYQLVSRQLSDLLNVLIVKKGYQMVTFTNSSYILVFNFRAYDQVEALECTYQKSAIQYLSQLNACLPNTRGSRKRITIKSILQC